MVAPSLNDAVFKDTVAKHGSFPVRASERSAHVIDDLDAGQAYDVFFAIEVRATPEANAHTRGLMTALCLRGIELGGGRESKF